MGKNSRFKKERRQERQQEQLQQSKKPISRRAVLTVVGALGLAGLATWYALPKSKDNPEDNGIITFEKAKKDESLRQPLLDHVFDNQDKYGVPGWDSFERILYDPEFKQMQADFKAAGIEDKSGNLIPEYGPRNKNFVRLMGTPYFGEKGKGMKSTVYVGRGVFNLWDSLDEICSGLDNESFHAQHWHKQTVHLLIPKMDMSTLSQYASKLFSEIASFDKQFHYIATGKRKVRPKYIQMTTNAARKLYAQLIALTKQNTPDGQFARGIRYVIEKRPSAIYFR